MNESRFNSIYRGMSIVAKKVFEAVPIEDQWTINKINAELRRTGHPMDMKIIGGCLASLVSQGVLIEIKTGTFSRIKIKEKSEAPAVVATQTSKPEKKEEQMSAITTQQLPPAKNQTAIDKLSALAASAGVIGAMLKKLASDIERAAIEIDDQNAARDAETGKLKQLQQLLKELA
jgi:hypothetical protein